MGGSNHTKSHAYPKSQITNHTVISHPCWPGVGASRVPLGLAPMALGFASMPLGLAMATFFFFVKLAPKRLYLYCNKNRIKIALVAHNRALAVSLRWVVTAAYHCCFRNRCKIRCLKRRHCGLVRHAAPNPALGRLEVTKLALNLDCWNWYTKYKRGVPPCCRQLH